METLVLEWENTSELLKVGISFVIGFVSFASGLFAYTSKKGVKFVSLERIANFKNEYNQLHEIAYEVTKNISKEELLAIFKVVIDLKTSDKAITAADVQNVGMMLVKAITTEEAKE